MDVEKLFPAIVQGNGLHCGKNGYTSSMDCISQTLSSEVLFSSEKLTPQKSPLQTGGCEMGFKYPVLSNAISPCVK